MPAPKTVTVFYENSMGFIAQWVCEVGQLSAHEVVLKFPGRSPKGAPRQKPQKARALRFDLRQSAFMVIATIERPWLGIGVDADSISVSQDETVRQRVLAALKGQIAHHWNGQQWEETSPVLIENNLEKACNV